MTDASPGALQSLKPRVQGRTARPPNSLGARPDAGRRAGRPALPACACAAGMAGMGSYHVRGSGVGRGEPRRDEQKGTLRLGGCEGGRRHAGVWTVQRRGPRVCRGPDVPEEGLGPAPSPLPLGPVPTSGAARWRPPRTEPRTLTEKLLDTARGYQGHVGHLTSLTSRHFSM